MSNKNKAIVCLEFPTESLLLKQFAAPQLRHLAILAFRQVGYEQSKLASHATALNLHSQDKSFFFAMFSTWVWLRAIHLPPTSFSWETKAPLGCSDTGELESDLLSTLQPSISVRG